MLDKSLRRPSLHDCAMASAEKAIYLDSSALVKLAVVESESAELRRYLRRRKALVSSSLAKVEVGRALLPFGREAVSRGEAVLTRIDLIRISDRVLVNAAQLQPSGLRSLDAIHLATAELLGDELARVVTYDDRMASAATLAGMVVIAPT